MSVNDCNQFLKKAIDDLIQYLRTFPTLLGDQTVSQFRETGNVGKENRRVESVLIGLQWSRSRKRGGGGSMPAAVTEQGSGLKSDSKPPHNWRVGEQEGRNRGRGRGRGGGRAGVERIQR